jgi:hypothetical protein
MEAINLVLTGVGAIVTGASLLVKLTPTVKDDAFMAKVVRIFEYASIFNAKIKK